MKTTPAGPDERSWADTSTSFYVSFLILLAPVGALHAQDEAAPAEEIPERMEEIVVHGIRASLSANLDIKRNSAAIVDAITAEDIGKFPDKNVADSLQRVPGIVITRDGGEGARVSIRGLSAGLTLTQINGNYIASPGTAVGNPSRSFDYTLLPAALVQRVEVFKTPEARIDEGGVGGTIIVHSRQPLDLDANSGALNVETTYADVTDDYEPNFTGFYSWKDADDRFGVLVGVTYQERTNRTLSGSSNLGASWRFATSATPRVSVDVDGNPTESTLFFSPLVDAFSNTYDGVWLPQAPGVEALQEDRQREGIQLTGQWRPTNRTEIAVNAFSFTLDQDRTLSQIMMPEWSNNPNYLTEVTLDPSGTVVTGLSYTAGASGAERNLQFPWIIGSFIREEATSNAGDIRFTFAGDDFSARFVAGATGSEGGPSEQWRAAYKSGAPASFTSSGRDESAADFAGWSLLGDRVSFFADPNLLDNLLAGEGGENDPGSTDSSFIVSELDETYAQFDIDFDVDWGIFNTVRAGVKYRNSEVDRETRNTFFLRSQAVLDDILTSGRDVDVVEDAYQWNGGMPLITDILNSRPMGNIPGGFDMNVMPTIDWDRYREIVIGQFPKYTRREPNFVFDVDEEITAAYVQGDFEFGDFRGNVGLRFVRTETSVASSDQITYFLDQNDDATGEQITGDARFIDQFAIITRGNTDDQVLPSLNLVWDVRDDLVARLAAAKTIARPGLVSLGSPERLNFVSQEWADDRLEFNDEVVEPGWSGQGGNKDLKPFESVQFDVSLEYYYKEGSAMGLALFHKDVDNFVVPLQIPSPRNFDGFQDIVPPGPITVNPFSTTANGSEATSQGIELFVQHAFDNGFGTLANFTYNDTESTDLTVAGEKVGESELVGSAETQFNLSAYYENQTFGARVSYNRRGDLLGGPIDSIPTIIEPYEQIDANAHYNIRDNLVLTASVINLTEEEITSRLGNDTNARLLSSVYSGRRFYVGLTYNY